MTSGTTGPGAHAVERRQRALAILAICTAAILPYLGTIDDYFARDDFGVIWLLEQKPAGYFPRWFVSSWMDVIWGFVPDEIRPFPAASYQLTALAGAGVPHLHHVVNILLHAGNALLVAAAARRVGIGRAGAVYAGVLFALLPVHIESVAWITGRVDSMPALVYLASFLLYARWRARGGAGAYVWSVVLFFVALFTKQNTITMAAALVAYDVIVVRVSLKPARAGVAARAWAIAAPYVPFVLLTAGYLWLRLLLFGEVAREGALTVNGLQAFAGLAARHFRHVVLGSADAPTLLVWMVLAGIVILWLWARRIDDRVQRAIVFFGPVWWTLGVAPTLVAGYASARHVYLAAVGWAVVAGSAVDLAVRHRPGARWRRGVVVVALLGLAAYLPSLVRDLREWHAIAAVSHKAVLDTRAEARAASPGTLLVLGVPRRSWDWALPFAVRPPYTPTDLTQRVFIIAPRALQCCAGQWFEETRRALRNWSAGDARDSAVLMRWNQDSGAVTLVRSADNPQVAVLLRSFLDLPASDDLDANITRLLDVLAPAPR